MHRFRDRSRPVGPYDFWYQRCDGCELNRLDEDSPEDTWLTDEQLNEKINCIGKE
jgi:hypothetical protein